MPEMDLEDLWNISQITNQSMWYEFVEGNSWNKMESDQSKCGNREY